MGAQENSTENSKPMPFPALAVRARLQAASSSPAWTSFLPAEIDSPLEVGALSIDSNEKERRYSAELPGPKSTSGVHGRENLLGRGELEEAPLTGSIWSLSRNKSGCWRVQDALEEATNNEARMQIAHELEGHIWEGSRCPHANYVIQKCITTMASHQVQFIIAELRHKEGSIATVAKHVFGCRILERLLEHCEAEQVRDIVEELLVDAVRLCKDSFGNFVMQHILVYGSRDQKLRLCQMIQDHVLDVSSTGPGCAVLSKTLSHGPSHIQHGIAQALLENGKRLHDISFTKQGHVAAKLTVKLLTGADREKARQLFEGGDLRNHRYGRLVALALETESPHVAERLVQRQF